MSVITYDPDDFPWNGQEVMTLLKMMPKNCGRIHVHFEYHNGGFDVHLPFVKEAFVESKTNTSTQKGVTLLDTPLIESVIKGFGTLIDTKPSYTIQTIRLIYTNGAIDLDVREEKTIKICGSIQVSSALECKKAVPNLKQYKHVFEKEDFM